MARVAPLAASTRFVTRCSGHELLRVTIAAESSASASMGSTIAERGVVDSGSDASRRVGGQGFSAATLFAAGVALAGALMALVLVPGRQSAAASHAAERLEFERVPGRLAVDTGAAS
jgi:hypothetical protein